MTTVESRAVTTREWLEDGRRVVVGLLVDIEGSAPLSPGAAMLIDEYGAIEGSITGGCVESAVAQEAQALLDGEDDGAPKLLRYGISDELAGTVGLMCGGIVWVLVHEVTGGDAETVAAAMEGVSAGVPVAVATLLDGANAGAKLAVVGDEVVGSLRGPELLDNSVARDAAGLLDQGVTGIRRYGSDGATLGADVRVHVRSYATAPQMLIFGAIDFSAALAPLAREIGYQVTICDARERFASSPRFSRAASVVIDWPDRALAGRRLGPRDAVLVFTHDPKFDEPALVAALNSDAGYVGALGSRRTTIDRARRLREVGVTDEQIERIFAPCGLDIGGRTPEETAISVLAEIIAVRAGRAGESLRTTEGHIQPRETAVG